MAKENKSSNSQNDKGKDSGNSQKDNKKTSTDKTPVAETPAPVKVEETNHAGVTRSYDTETGKYKVEGVSGHKDGVEIAEQNAENEKKTALAENQPEEPAATVEKPEVAPAPPAVPAEERKSIVSDSEFEASMKPEDAGPPSKFEIAVKKLLKIWEVDKTRVNCVQRFSMRNQINQVGDIGGYTWDVNPNNDAEAAIVLMSPECAAEFEATGTSDKLCFRWPEKGYHPVGPDPQPAKKKKTEEAPAPVAEAKAETSEEKK